MMATTIAMQVKKPAAKATNAICRAVILILVAGFGTAFGVRNTEHVSEVQTAAVCERHY
jgi:hypothetical protein